MTDLIIKLAPYIAGIVGSLVGYLTFRESKRKSQHDELSELYDKVEKDNDRLRKENSKLRKELDKKNEATK